MELRRVEALTSWITGRWGVPEPDPTRTALWELSNPPDIVLVPGLAFNEHGGRLGYGGGYYDQLYAKLQVDGDPSSLWVGFAFANQIVEAALPLEPHDLRLQALATDEGIRWFGD
jgi:5-formyltetrahydrofolate cyclo-ligase